MIVAHILEPLEDILMAILDWLGPHGSIGLTWAWSIVALTAIVRLLMVPLAVKQIHSMQAMQAHMPEMKRIQQQYKNDKQKRNEELMKFYRDNNVNPAAPCLPLLFQFPVFIALYLILRDPDDLMDPGDQRSWLSIVPDITDHANAHWSGYVLLVIYVCSQLASTYFMSTTMDKTQRTLMMILPGRVRARPRQLPGGARHLLGDDEPVDRGAGSRHAPFGAQEASGASETVVEDAPEESGRVRRGGGRRDLRSRAGGSRSAEAREAEKEEEGP